MLDSAPTEGPVRAHQGNAAQKLQDVGLYHVEKSGAPASSSVIVIPSRRGERRRGGRENLELCAPGFAGFVGEIGPDQLNGNQPSL